MLAVRISNPGGNADSANLAVSFSGLSYVSAQVDRGSGCTAGGGGASCFLDFFNSGLSATELINAVVTSLPASATASVSSSPTGSSDSASWSGAGQPPATASAPVATTPFSPPRVAASVKTARLTVEVKGKGSVPVLRRPAKTAYAQGAKVALTARPAKGWLFGHWSGACAGKSSPVA